MANHEDTACETPAPEAGDAVGVPTRHWYVAIVGNNTEKQCAKKLCDLGYECYVPTQTETRLWRNGTRKVVDRILLPAMVLTCVTEPERRQVVSLSYVKRFLSNRASATDAFGKHRVATIPDDQVERLKFMVGNADEPVEFEPAAYRLGDRVRIARGRLQGIEGHIVECGEETYFALRVEMLGLAKVRVRPEDLERI